eukprot:SAG22_NODE_118_length_19263_cov_16.155813_6_plen_249_part_00
MPLLSTLRQKVPCLRLVWTAQYYSAMLADLVREYPAARVVMTHRRPVKVMTSISSLQMKLRSVTTDNATPAGIAAELTELWDPLAGACMQSNASFVFGPKLPTWCSSCPVLSCPVLSCPVLSCPVLSCRPSWTISWTGRAARAVAAREAWSSGGGGPGGGLVDVELGELHRDPMAAVERIYRELGLPLTASAAAKMRVWLAANSREKHGKNSYKAEWFGLEDAEATLRKNPGLKVYDDFVCEKFPAVC